MAINDRSTINMGRRDSSQEVVWAAVWILRTFSASCSVVAADFSEAAVRPPLPGSEYLLTTYRRTERWTPSWKGSRSSNQRHTRGLVQRQSPKARSFKIGHLQTLRGSRREEGFCSDLHVMSRTGRKDYASTARTDDAADPTALQRM